MEPVADLEPGFGVQFYNYNMHEVRKQLVDLAIDRFITPRLSNQVIGLLENYA